LAFTFEDEITKKIEKSVLAVVLVFVALAVTIFVSDGKSS
jgi:hypothetical protein